MEDYIARIVSRENCYYLGYEIREPLNERGMTTMKDNCNTTSVKHSLSKIKPCNKFENSKPEICCLQGKPMRFSEEKKQLSF